jgi:hypothetical protein
MTGRLLAIAASGWLLLALLALTIALPYYLRRRRLRLWRSPLPPEPARPGRLRFHYWLGYAIAALALVHGMASMTRGIAGRHRDDLPRRRRELVQPHPAEAALRPQSALEHGGAWIFAVFEAVWGPPPPPASPLSPQSKPGLARVPARSPLPYLTQSNE